MINKFFNLLIVLIAGVMLIYPSFAAAMPPPWPHIWRFITPPVAPSVTTNPASNRGQNSVTGNGYISATGGASVTTRGFIHYADSGNCEAKTDGTTTSQDGTYGTGLYSLTIGGLSPGATYYYRAFATNLAGSGFGECLPFETAVLPTVILQADPITVDYGGSSTLLWTSTGADTCYSSSSPVNADWNSPASNIGKNGSKLVRNIVAETTFTLRCVGGGGEKSTSVAVYLSGGNCSISSNTKMRGAFFCESSFSTGESGEFTGSFVTGKFNVPSSVSNLGFFYDYNLDSNWPPGFRFLNMPHAAPGE